MSVIKAPSGDWQQQLRRTWTGRRRSCRKERTLCGKLNRAKSDATRTYNNTTMVFIPVS